MCCTNDDYIIDLPKDMQNRMQMALKTYFADKYSTSELTDDDIDSFVEDAMCGSIGEAETLIGCDMMNKVLENQHLNLSKVGE